MSKVKSKYAPVCLFVFSREDYTERVLNSLANNTLAKETDVYVFADMWVREKDQAGVEKVRKVINDPTWKEYFNKFEVNASDEHKGLARSVIDGVTKVINDYGRAIVVEDDLILAPLYLAFMNEALDVYETDLRVGSVSGYQNNMPLPKDYKEDVYLFYRSCSWGWGTWKRVWDNVNWNISDYDKFKHSLKDRLRFDRAGYDMSLMLDDQMNGEIDSWSIRFDYNLFRMDLLSVYSSKPYIKNGGFDSRATHTVDESAAARFSGGLSDEPFRVKRVELDRRLCRLERDYYCSIFELIERRLRRVYGFLKEKI